MNNIGNFLFETYSSSCIYLQSKLTKQNLTIWAVANAIFAVIAINTTLISTPVIAAVVGTEATIGILFAIHAIFFSHLSKNKPIPLSALLNAMETQIKNIPVADSTYNKAKLFYNIYSGGKQCCGSVVIENSGNTFTKKDLDNQINDYMKNLHESSFKENKGVKLKFNWLIALRREEQVKGIELFDYSSISASDEFTVFKSIETLSLHGAKKVTLKAIESHVLQFMDASEPITFD